MFLIMTRVDLIRYRYIIATFKSPIAGIVFVFYYTTDHGKRLHAFDSFIYCLSNLFTLVLSYFQGWVDNYNGPTGMMASVCNITVDG